MYRTLPIALASILAGALVLIAVASAMPAQAAQEPKSLGKFDSWEAFAEPGGGGKVCYAAALPRQSKNAPAGRGRAYSMLSNHPADKSFGVIGFTAGFALKKGSPAMLQIGATKFELYAVGDTAWARDDKAVVAALAKARSATFVGIPAKGDPVADNYALDGFADARAAIDKECGAK